MRTRIAGVAVVALLAGTFAGCGWGGSPYPTPSLTVLAPNGGEAWTVGAPATVTWTSSDFVGNVDIDYSMDGCVTWVSLVSNTPNDGGEVVTGHSIACDTVCVQVSAADGDPSIATLPWDRSDADFCIEPVPSVTVLTPNGGEVWTTGSAPTITWESVGLEGNVDIDVSMDGGVTWTMLVADTPNDGTEIVTVPATHGPTGRVQVSAADGDPSIALAPSDVSDANFGVGDPWVDIEAGIVRLRYSAVAWGDYDSDGDLDLALAGRGSAGYMSLIYRNDGETFTDIAAGLPGVENVALAWGDYDNDGDLDLALAGYTGSAHIFRIYRNDGETFTDIAAGLPGVENVALAWGDYDNDGDLDLAVTGNIGDGNFISRIYRNDGGIFADIVAGLPGVGGSLAWVDYDNDGDVDLALAGNRGGSFLSCICRNDEGTFTTVTAGLPGMANSAMAWGDYDDDGDLDLGLVGAEWDVGSSGGIYRNDGGTFTKIGASVVGVQNGCVVWGDYDNDGDLDLALAGGGTTRIYRNHGGTFTFSGKFGAGLPYLGAYSAIAWGDCDGDGDLDLAVVGDGISRIYRNDGGFFPNTPPSAPTDVRASSGGGVTVITWLPADDLETPSSALSYNLRIGLTPTDDGDYPSMADGTGFRRIPARGPITSNALFGAAWLTLPPGETYYVSVQAVDTSFEGGPWSTPVAFTVPFDHTSAELKGLSASAGALAPTFNSGTLTYAVSSTTLPETTTITPTSADPEATIRVNSLEVPSGTASSPISLPAGLTTTTVTIELTARDGIATKTYTIVFTRMDGGGSDTGSGGGQER